MMPQSKVVIIKSRKKLSGNGILDQNQLIRMFQRGLLQLTMQSDFRTAINSFFTQRNKIGIKINTIGGKKLSTRPETALSLARLLEKSGIQPENILIWDRSNRELRASGYSLKMSRKGYKIFGTDSQGIGYDRSLTSHLNIGSLFSSIQTKLIDSSISLAVLKDHGLAGVTASMKNYLAPFTIPINTMIIIAIPMLLNSVIHLRLNPNTNLPFWMQPWSNTIAALLFTNNGHIGIKL